MSAPLRSTKEASSLLGTYLLQGWVMTDQICPIDGCSYPLMRSKDGSHSFCVHHDPLPNSSAKKTATAPVKKEEPKVDVPKVDDSEVDELALRRQRREQSSKASQLIGQKMLQKWALLNEQCPNDSCYAIPLIRHPTTRQMYCVICENFVGSKEEKEKAKVTKQAEKVETSELKRQAVEDNQEAEIKITMKPETIKRQRTSELFASQSVLSTLSKKMEELNDRVRTCCDPAELTQLFKSIKSCANAIKACVEAEYVCNKST